MTSSYLSNEWKLKSSVAKSAVSKLDQEVKSLKSLDSDVSSLLDPSKEMLQAKPLDEQVTAVMMLIRGSSRSHGVNLGFVAPSKTSGNSGFTQVLDIQEVIPDTDVASVKLNLTGTYKSYTDFIAFISSMKELPVAVVSLRVFDNQFEMSYRVYGLKVNG